MENAVYKKIFSKDDYAYWIDCRHRGILDLSGPIDLTLYQLFNGMISKEECTPEFMLWIIRYANPIDCLSVFLTLRPENEIPDATKIVAARKGEWGEVLHMLQNPSDAVINATLEKSGEYIVNVKHPTEQQWILALQHSREHPELITKVAKPTIQMQKIHVMRYLDGIDYIENPCEAVKIAAAKGNGVQILRRIKNPSEQVILTAIAHTYMTEIKDFLFYIPHPNHKIYCAIKHQININKGIMAQIESKQEPQPPEPTEPDYGMLIQKCAELDPLRTVQASTPDVPIQEKKAILTKLYDELRTNALNDLLGYKNSVQSM